MTHGVVSTIPELDQGAAMIEFGRQWHPHGGGDALAILSKFGMSTDEYFTGLQFTLQNAPPTHIDPISIESMKRACRRRLWLGQ